jgi:ankyrin repeat protein
MDPEKKIIAAAQQGDLQALEALVAAGADVNEKDEQGWTALHWSAGRGDAGAVNLLLEHQADVTLVGRDNRTPLMVARAAGRHDAVSVLTAAEKAKGVWKDPRESKPYCKAYYWKDLARYPQWAGPSSQGNGTEQIVDSDSILYVHQDFTVTRSVWPGENVIFKTITPEWIQFCKSELKFAIPADLI